jgi:hypothetical protein
MRTNKVAAAFAIVFTLGLAFMLASCTADAKSSNVEPPPVASDQSTDPDGASFDDLEDYLNSPQRTSRYATLASEASAVIAQALNNGVFGQPQRYTEMKQYVNDEYSGWGIVTVSYKGPSEWRPSAWVFWNSDGSIDGSKTALDVTIANKEGQVDTYITVSDPSPASDYWVAAQYDGTTITTLPMDNDALRKDGWHHEVDDLNFTTTWPSSLQGYKEFDDTVLEQLEANMVSWFGNDWRNYR